ncbi:helix-turn-helix transcriptional regulator [Streptomyces lasiicapitis]|uniref:DNA-binding protein n=1 Tax=Streptomyces lasiicapitis TaxID=1923961 RepID=A0ABQ2LGW8_9ACTN|nr:helix-turn-helix transcriptional regulator [Streptomyces lasiicapitis]GGO33174.1 DNA-binding protein [Streptomyces lasiicapitis]
MDRREELREFLRSRRARVSPEEAGVARDTGFTGRRRVPGLRREELAQLSGVSVDYYVRLEQGRGGSASAEVLDAIARVLRLDEHERAHLYSLVRGEDSRPLAGHPQEVRPGVRRLLDTLAYAPAYVVGRRLEILAWNDLARILIADFPALAPEDRNLARLTFLDGSARQRYVHWQQKADDTVAFLRLDAGRHPDDARLASLIEELTEQSEDFRRLWNDHNVRDKTYGDKPLYHPLVGTLDVSFETLGLPDEPDQAVVVYLAAPGSRAASELRLLATKG